MRTKKGKKGFLAIKVDLEKAFDRLSWNFIEDTLSKIGMQPYLIKIIISAISTSRMRILWNGVPTQEFHPSRGIRQGDPLSPYLFVLCMERLNHCILSRVYRGDWKPIKLSKNGPPITHLFFADDLILFAEASLDQLHVMKECLDMFCKASGQKINISKTKLYCSKNVHINRALEFSRLLGVSLTGHLGKYLGIPLLHKRVTKRMFSSILDKVDKRLSGWKGKFLNQAGRTTLIKSVLSSLPNYYMQTMLLPTGVINEIDRKCRDFLWNSLDEERKPHLISWDKVTKQKDTGGLGIKNIKSQNIAFVMKLCWGLVTKKNCLWVKIIRDKYKCGNVTIPMIIKEKNCSLTWRSICKVWDKFMEGIGWTIGRGDSVSFWFDKWAPPATPLIHFCTKSNLSCHERVLDFTDQHGYWNLTKLHKVLPRNIVNQIKLVKPPCSNNIEDSICWRSSHDGLFSVKAAYHDIEKDMATVNSKLWSTIWKLPVYEKIKYFVWKMAHDRLHSGVTTNGDNVVLQRLCPFGCNTPESTLHIVRDCHKAKEVWIKLVSPNFINKFFSLPLQDWTLWSASKEIGSHFTRKVPWKRIFGHACWLLWKARCRRVFSDDEYDEWDIAFLSTQKPIDDMKLEAMKSDLGLKLREVYSTWRPPKSGWIRLDTDASINLRGEATCGGVFRDCNGDWSTGFMAKLGVLSITSAELVSILHGLTLGWNNGVKKISVFSDSLEAVNLITRGNINGHPLRNVIEAIRDLITRNWSITLEHTFREANKCANWLAQHAHEISEDFLVLRHPPLGCWHFLNLDRGIVINPLNYPM